MPVQGCSMGYLQNEEKIPIVRSQEKGSKGGKENPANTECSTNIGLCFSYGSFYKNLSRISYFDHSNTKC